MSGVAASLSRSAACEESVLAMLEAMPHRGRRLEYRAIHPAVLGARAPDSAFATMGAVSVVADVRIDNRPALASEGLEFEDDDSDATLIAAAYRRWGGAFPEHLIGELACIVWDADQQRLTCVRDRMGQRALYYHDGPNGLLFASEKQALFAPGHLQKRPNRLAIALYLALQHSETRQTLFEGVHALPPAHVLEASADGMQLRRYWTPDPWTKLPAMRDEEYVEMFGATFREAVRCRMQGPVGIFVSGGVDSTSVAVQAAALANGSGPPTVLHLAYEGMKCDETQHSDAVARRWDMPVISMSHREREHAVRPHAPDHPDMLYHPLQTCFLPLLERARKQGIRTVLTGHGGDQLLDEMGGECADALVRGDLRQVAEITGIAREPFAPRPYRVLFGALRKLIPEPLRDATWRWRDLRGHPLLTRQWNDRVFEFHYAERASQFPDRLYPDHTSAELCREIYRARTQLPMRHNTLMGEVVGVNVTHPFHDQRVFELMLGMPQHLRLRHGVPKHKPLLRRSMSDLLPKTVLRRKDAMGFSWYIRDFFLRRHRAEVTAMLDETRLAQLGIVDDRAIRAAVEEGLSAPFIDQQLAHLLSMELWLRRDFT